MVREMNSQLEYIHRYISKYRGFTLLELIISISVMAIMVGVAAPSFSELIERNKITRLATEIEWLLVQAKSEAVLQGEDVEVTINGASTPVWSIRASNKSSTITIGEISSTDFSNIILDKTFSDTSFIFDSVTGRPNNSGGYEFNIPNKNKLKVTVNLMTGRIYTCGVGEKIYQYEKCYS